jgi:hypothetical protein
MTLETIKKITKFILSQVIAFTDYILFLLVISFFILDLVRVCSFCVENISALNYSSADSILQMSINNNGFPGNQGFPGNPNNMGVFPGGPAGPFGGPNVTHHTDVRISHDDGN